MSVDTIQVIQGDAHVVEGLKESLGLDFLILLAVPCYQELLSSLVRGTVMVPAPVFFTVL